MNMAAANQGDKRVPIALALMACVVALLGSQQLSPASSRSDMLAIAAAIPNQPGETPRVQGRSYGTLRISPTPVER